MKRRNLLCQLLGCALIPVTGALGVLVSGFASARQQIAFDAKTPKDAIEQIFGGQVPESTNLIKIIAPEIAENGTVVPITIESSLPGIESISILAKENPRALAASVKVGKRATFPISLRVKLAKSQEVQVLVLAQGKLYTASRPIKVSVGGCGG